MTLVEVIVASAIFISVLLAATSIFLTVAKNQRRMFIAQELQDNGRFIIESVAKEIRTSRSIKTSPVNCNNGSSDIINVINQAGKSVEFQFKIAPKPEFQRKDESGGWKTLNSSRTLVSGEFNVICYGDVGPANQAVVTITLRLQSDSAANPVIYTESSLSPRIY